MNEAVVETVPLAPAARSEGFAELYERTFPRVYAYVASLLRDSSAAERSRTTDATYAYTRGNVRSYSSAKPSDGGAAGSATVPATASFTP